MRGKRHRRTIMPCLTNESRMRRINRNMCSTPIRAAVADESMNGDVSVLSAEDVINSILFVDYEQSYDNCLRELSRCKRVQKERKRLVERMMDLYGDDVECKFRLRAHDRTCSAYASGREYVLSLSWSVQRADFQFGCNDARRVIAVIRNAHRARAVV